jgi:hypothetical protein
MFRVRIIIYPGSFSMSRTRNPLNNISVEKMLSSGRREET